MIASAEKYTLECMAEWGKAKGKKKIVEGEKKVAKVWLEPTAEG